MARWYNGITWVSKTYDGSSILSRVAKIKNNGLFVYRLGRWPFTPERGVRFPYDLPSYMGGAPDIGL
jgi:hypothetical protein